MNRLKPLLFGALTLLFSTSIFAVPRGNDQIRPRDPNRPPAPGMVVDPGSFEFTLPKDVAGHAVLSLENTGGPVLRYTVTSVIAAGFRGAYYNNAAGNAPAFGDLVFERQDEEIDFNWGANGPANGLANDHFGVIWNGTFIAPANGRYGFRTTTDDGVRFFIDDQQLIDDWNDHVAASREWSGNLSIGPHRIRMEYYENANASSARLSWMVPNGNWTIMPGESERGWIDFAPSHGSIAAGNSVDIAVTIETINMDVGGEYTDSIYVKSNDQNNPTIIVPITVFVTQWRPGAVEPGQYGVNIDMEAGAEAEASLTLNSVGEGNYDFEAQIVGEDVGWLDLSPLGGRIGPGLSEDLSLNFNAAGREAGLYNATIVLTGNDRFNPTTEISVTMAIGAGYSTISGVVTNLSTHDPIPGAHVGVVGYGYATEANEDGEFRFDAPAVRHVLWAESPEYNRYESDAFDLREGQGQEINAALRQGILSPIVPELELALAPDDTMTFPLGLRNRGNGPVRWAAEIVHSLEHNAPAWQSRMRFDVVGEDINDSRINGVEYVDGYFYVSGGNEARGVGRIYVFDHEGEYVRYFDQFVNGTQNGMYGLTYDGQWLWGSDGGILYGFTTDGELMAQFEGPLNPSRALAYDPDGGVIWISDRQSTMYSYDLEGNQVRRVANPGGRRSGLAWYADDPDGYPLYMFTNDVEHPLAIQKYSPDRQDMMFVTDVIGMANDGPGGIAISGSWDPYTWTLICLMQQPRGSNDAVQLFHISTRNSWVSLLNDEGSINQGQIEDLDLLLDTDGLVLDAQYEADIVVRHDGRGRAQEIPITLTVSGEGGFSGRIIPLPVGWNLISTNIFPDGREDFAGIMAGLIDEGSLILAKDGSGNFFRPDHGFNNIEAWDELQGYWLKVAMRTELRLEGDAVPMDSPIELNDGWNTISYLPRIPVSPDVILGGLGDNLVIARNGNGNFYLPAYNFNDIDLMREGLGYQLNVTQGVEFSYNFEGAASRRAPRYTQIDRAWMQDLAHTGSMFNLLVRASYPEGTRLEALTPENIVAGRGVVGEDGLAGITLWGDDPTTTECEGFKVSELPTLRVVGSNEAVLFTVEKGSVAWNDGDWAVVVAGGAEVPLQFAISSAYPNPFNSTLRIAYSLPEEGMASLKVFDLAGREVALLLDGNRKAGTHSAVWNGGAFSSGVYLLKLESGSQRISQKVLLIK